jgi:hypothetical protein
MSKYTEYDLKLQELIRGGCSTFDALVRRLSLENKTLRSGEDSWRLTDSRLQALRRKGLIAYHRQHWSVVPRAPQ